MSMLSRLATTGGAPEKTYIEDVFSTVLYTGTGSPPLTINTGIDVNGKGGMTWIKSRNNATNNILITKGLDALSSNSTGAAGTPFSVAPTWTSTGVTLFGSPAEYNTANYTYASWTFRKAPKFFDVVTWTSTATAFQTIAHSLGQAPGMIVIKCTSTGDNWYVYHRSTSNGYLDLNDTYSLNTAYVLCQNVTSTSFEFNSAFYTTGRTFVAYLFAHDTSTDGLIQCGSFTTDGGGKTASPVVLGWEPQYVMIKSTTATPTGGDNWFIYDTMRGFPTATEISKVLIANGSNAETNAQSALSRLNITNTGFEGYDIDDNQTYIYMAIRRGPMKTPTDGAKVFQPRRVSLSTVGSALYNGFGNSPRVADDAHFIKTQASTSAWYVESRLLGAKRLDTTSTAAEASDTAIDYSGGSYGTAYSTITAPVSATSMAYVLRRAPGFFDVVCYTGTGSARTVAHNLGVAPELMIVKSRVNSYNWVVYSATTGASKYLKLNLTDAEASLSTVFNGASPTSASFTLGVANLTNLSGGTYVAYIFASCPGVSKVGSFTGNGSTQTINCGFTNGARFVLIKRTDSTSNWMVWDTERGITTTGDPLLLLNSTAAETSGADQIQPNSTGFTVQYAGPSTDSAPNINGATYIYLAIA